MDHESTKHLLEQRLHTNLKLKGISKLLKLGYRITYRKGIENKVAYAFSSRPQEEECFVIHATS